MTPLKQPDLNLVIDRTLRHLADTAPAPGLEQRLKESLRGQSTTITVGRSFPFRTFGTAAALLLLCALGAVLLTPHLRSLHHAPASGIQSSQRETEQTHSPQNAPALFAHAHQASPDTTPTMDLPPRSARDRSSSTVPSPLVHLQLSSAAPSGGPSDPDAQALADLNTPSFPAPPLPLTAQERAVRLMLRHGERRDLAQLEPGRQDALLQQDQTAFSKFFDPPTDPALRNQPRSLAEMASTPVR